MFCCSAAWQVLRCKIMQQHLWPPKNNCIVCSIYILRDAFQYVYTCLSCRPSLIEVIEDPVLSEWAVALNREWQSLGRQVSSSVKEKPDQHSLLSIPHPFIIPGGRFGELYYW